MAAGRQIMKEVNHSAKTALELIQHTSGTKTKILNPDANQIIMPRVC